MGGNQNINHFFKDKPLFGLDIGSNSIKVMQVKTEGNKSTVKGYGYTSFDESAIKNSVICDYKKLAKPIKELFKHGLVGDIDTRRVALSIPASSTYTRTITLPIIDEREMIQAVYHEAEQYIPRPMDELYLDYTLIQKDQRNIELLAVAAPKNIVDSHIALAKMLGLDPVVIDTTILAAARLFKQQSSVNNIPTVIIDIGTTSADITVHDRTVIVTDTISGGGAALSDSIAKKLNVSIEEAHIIKVKYGLSKSKKQQEIIQALTPWLENLVKEINRLIRYHEERSGSKQKVQQVISSGGGANTPGLSEYLTSSLRIPVRTCNPWQNLSLDNLSPPKEVEKSIYATVAGLALVQPQEIF